MGLVGLTGGGSRSDIISLIILRPLTILFLIFVIWRISIENAKSVFAPMLFMGLLMALALLQLVPLPFAFWSSLPGRAPIAELDRLLGLEGLWRPLSLNPNRTWNAFFSMFVPLTAIGFVGLLWKRERRWIFIPVVALALVSAAIGYLQAIGADSLHFYRVTHSHHPVGLFANKNHQSVLLNWLLLTVCFLITRIDPSDRKANLHLSAGLTLVFLIFPLLFVTGSRAGLLLAAPVSAACLWMLLHARALGKAWKKSQPRVRFSLTALGIVVFSALVIVFAYLAITGRQTALVRLFEAEPADELRWIYFSTIVQMAIDQFFAGIGFGAFESFFYSYESVDTLTTSYLNQAHVEPLQFIIETGILGLVLALAAMYWVASRLIALWRFGDDGTRMRCHYIAASLALWLLAGLVDYPLRTPIVQLIFATLTGILAASSIDLRRHRNTDLANNDEPAPEAGLVR